MNQDGGARFSFAQYQSTVGGRPAASGTCGSYELGEFRDVRASPLGAPAGAGPNLSAISRLTCVTRRASSAMVSSSSVPM